MSKFLTQMRYFSNLKFVQKSNTFLKMKSNGKVINRKYSLFMTILQSELYCQKKKPKQTIIIGSVTGNDYVRNHKID